MRFQLLKRNNFKSLQDTNQTRKSLFFSILFFFLIFISGLLYFDFSALIELFPDYTRNEWMTVVYGIAVIALGGSVKNRFSRYIQSQRLDTEGVAIPAEITDRYIFQAVDTIDYVLTYAYLGQFHADAFVSLAIYEKAREGDTVVAIYLENEPKISRLDLTSIPDRPASPIDTKPASFWG